MRVFLWLVVIAALILIPVGIAAAQTEYDGLWYNEGAGVIITIENNTLTVLEPGEDGCVPADELTLDGDNLLVDGEVIYTLKLEDDTLLILQNEAPVVDLERIDSVESICTVTPFTVTTQTVNSWEDVDALIGEVFAQTDIPGMAIAFVGPDGVLWSNGYGVISTDTEAPVTSDTPFMLASVTKTVTGTSLMIAWEEKQFDLDGDINAWLPFAVDNPHTEGEVITPRTLATHTSGIMDYYPVYLSLYGPGDSPIALGDFLQGYLVEGGEWYNAEGNYADRMPGTAWAYSNVGAALAGYLVEQITGTPLDQYATDHIFGPLNMSNTHWHLADYADTSVIASPHDEDGKPMEHYGYPTWPDGGLRSSANDLGRFLAVVMNGGELDGTRILSADTVNLMFQAQLPAVSEYQGWFWDLGEQMPGYIGHGGGDPGVSTLVMFNPEIKLGFVILTNTSSSDVQRAFEAYIPLVMENAEKLLSE